MCVSSVKRSKVQHCCLTKTNSCAALTSDESLLGEEGEVLLRRRRSIVEEVEKVLLRKKYC